MESNVRHAFYDSMQRFAQLNRLPIELPNKPFNKPINLETYLSVMTIPVPPTVLTVCAGGAKYKWILQTSIFYEHNKGEIRATKIVDKLRDYFPPSKKLRVNDSVFTIIMPVSAAPPIRVDESWHQMPTQFRVQAIC